MKTAAGERVWKAEFRGGRVDTATGATADHAAKRIARIYFGRRAYARRITGRPGDPTGTFEVCTESSDKVLATFSIKPTTNQWAQGG